MDDKARIAKARQMFEAVKAGRTLFTWGRDRWMIVGPTADLEIGKPVTVTKADGSTVTVWPSIHNNSVTRNGVDYSMWEFQRTAPTGVSQAPRHEPAPGEDALDRPVRRRGYRTVHSSLYGEGRVYFDQPGAAQYRGADGAFSVQIWDND